MNQTFSGDYHIARDIVDATAVDRLGWKMTLRVFRALRRFGIITAGATSAVATATVVTLLFGRVGSSGSHFALWAVLLVIVYLNAGPIARTLVSGRRETLANHPFRAFHRALDISRRSVVMAEIRPLVSLIFTISVGIVVATLAVFTRDKILSPLSAGALVLTPIAGIILLVCVCHLGWRHMTFLHWRAFAVSCA